MLIPQSVIDASIKSQAKWKVPASVSIAQWALESNWGRSLSGKNNPFGIKALAGHSSTPRMTWEVIHGNHVRMVQNFADFDSMDEAFDLHGRLLAQSSHYVNAMKHIGDANAFANALTGVYATDPQYGSKLINTMKAHNLYQYDARAT